jgi:hypothetical protein
MGLVKTMGRYCFITCDGPDCSKKIEHVDLEQVKQLARLCGWERRGEQWICPDCAARLFGDTPSGRPKGRSASKKEGHTATR